MSKRIVLIRNMGNSGGAWLMEVLNKHVQISMFQEINQVLRLKYQISDKSKKNMVYPNIEYDVKIAQRSSDLKGFLFNSRTQCEIATQFLLYQFAVQKEEVIGLIKCFDHTSIKTCREKCPSVKVVQVLRNPIGIIDFYTSKKNLRQIAHHESYEISFKRHVDLFSDRIITFLKNRDEANEKIIRLEDINISLRQNDSFFKELMEDLFEVDWSNEFIKEIKQRFGYGNDADQNREIWKNWDEWKKEYFKTHVGETMLNLGYGLG